MKNDPDDYQLIEGTFIQLSGESAKKLYKNSLEKLKEAKKHRIGTKIRLKKILSYLYTYGCPFLPIFMGVPFFFLGFDHFLNNQ